MSWTFKAQSATVSAFNATISPAIPAGVVAGDLLVLRTQAYMGSLAPPAITGWTDVAPHVNSSGVPLYLRIATGSDTAPNIAWGNQWADAEIYAFSGGPASLSGIVHASIDKTSTTTKTISYTGLTITQANCLVLAYGTKDKNAASNGATCGAMTGFTLANQNTIAGTSIASVFNYQIQTTATNIPSEGQTFSVADSSSQQYESCVIALLPNASGPLNANALGYGLTLEGVSFAVAGAGALAAGSLSFAATVENVTLASSGPVQFSAGTVSFALTLENATLQTGAISSNTYTLIANPVALDWSLAGSTSGFGIDAAVLNYAFTPQGVTFAASNQQLAIAAGTVSFSLTPKTVGFSIGGAPVGGFNASFWTFAAMDQYVIAVPYTLSAAYTGPYLWSNQGQGNQFVRPSGAPGCRVGANVGQFLMLGDLYQQRQQLLFTGDGAKASFSGAIPVPMTDGGSIFDLTGSLSGSISNGLVTGSGILVAGTLNYATGSLALSFSQAVPPDDPVYAQYTQVAPYRVQWSAIGDPTNWPIPLTQDALAAQSGYQDLEVDLGQVMLIAGYPLYGLIFQKFGITRANYIGGNVVFSFATYERKRGLISHGAAVQVGAYVFFLAGDGFYATDGANVVPIGTASDNSYGIDSWFWANVNQSFLESIRGGYDAVKRSVMFAIPTGNNVLPDTLLTYNLLSQRWTKSAVSVESIWTTDDGTDAAPGSRQTLGIFDQTHTPATLSGPPLTGYLESCDTYYLDSNRRLTTGVRPLVSSTDQPEVTIGVRNSLADPITYSSAFPDDFSRIAPFLASGVYTRVKIASSNAQAMQGATLSQETEGSV